MSEAHDPNPFGRSITLEDILDNLSFLDDWEDRYAYIIDLGKQVAALPDESKTDASLVRGCQSQVWLVPSIQDGEVNLLIDSDAMIVKGLSAIVMAIFNAKSPADVLSTDYEAIFSKMDLFRHISPTRGNGLRSMIERIIQYAKDHL